MITLKKRSSKSTLIPNGILEDNRLTLAAMGLLVILYTITGDITMDVLMARTVDSPETIQAALEELAGWDYVTLSGTGQETFTTES